MSTKIKIFASTAFRIWELFPTMNIWAMIALLLCLVSFAMLWFTSKKWQLIFWTSVNEDSLRNVIDVIWRLRWQRSTTTSHRIFVREILWDGNDVNYVKKMLRKMIRRGWITRRFARKGKRGRGQWHSIVTIPDDFCMICWFCKD